MTTADAHATWPSRDPYHHSIVVIAMVEYERHITMTTRRLHHHVSNSADLTPLQSPVTMTTGTPNHVTWSHDPVHSCIIQTSQNTYIVFMFFKNNTTRVSFIIMSCFWCQYVTFIYYFLCVHKHVHYIVCPPKHDVTRFLMLLNLTLLRP